MFFGRFSLYFICKYLIFRLLYSEKHASHLRCEWRRKMAREGEKSKRNGWVSWDSHCSERCLSLVDFKTLDCKYLLVQNAILFFRFVSITLEYFRKSRFFDVYRSHNNRNSYSSMMSSKHATARRSRTSRKGAIMLVKSTKKVKLDHWQRKQNSHRLPLLLRKLNILISRQEEAVSTHLPRGDRRFHLTASSVCLRSLIYE